jgi:hypothetical protein
MSIEIKYADGRSVTVEPHELGRLRLRGEAIEWCGTASKPAIADILRGHALLDPDPDSRMTAVDFLLAHPDWGWRDFAASKHPQLEWAFNVLSLYLRSTPDPFDDTVRAFSRASDRAAARVAARSRGGFGSKQPTEPR